MRAVLLLLTFVLLRSVQTAEAQDLRPSPVTPHLAASATAPTAAVSASTSIPFAPAPAEAGRDRGRGALIGFAAGALVGGVGFAATNYAFTDGPARTVYTVPSFFLGAAVGGVAGAVVGAIIGTPEREETGRQQVRLHLSPDLYRGGMAAVSVSF